MSTSTLTNVPNINYADFHQEHWSATEQQNVKKTLEFVQLLMNEHNFEEIRKRYANKQYIQHNRNIPDGISNLLNYVQNLTKRFNEYSYDVKRVFADGDEVILHVHATLKKSHRKNDQQGFNIVDYWTVKDGVLIEHWDAVQPLSFSMRLLMLLTGGKIEHSNGVF